MAAKGVKRKIGALLYHVVVAKDVPDYAIAAGVPAKVMRIRKTF